MSALPVASARLSNLCILCVNDLLDGDLCEKYLLFIYVSFWFSNMILSDALILPVSQLKTQQVMTSQIRSHIEYFRHVICTKYCLNFLLKRH